MQHSNVFDPQNRIDVTARAVVSAAVEVHRELGPGLLESVYESCLCRELEVKGLAVERQRAVPLRCRGEDVGLAFRLDLVIDSLVAVEVKAVAQVVPLHHAQLMTYLRVADLPLGLLLNFNVSLMKYGITRITT